MWIVWMIAACAVVVYWKAALAFLGIILCYLLVATAHECLQQKIAAQLEARRRLVRNADREHKLVQEGRLDGVYGEYPTPEECRGIGIWLTDRT